MSDVILRNNAGVEIRKSQKFVGVHHLAVGALCECGGALMVAPMIFNADHKPGDPVMVCDDHGVHAYRFSDLVSGRQPKALRDGEEA